MSLRDALNETELLTLLREGDERAFTAIYNRFWKILFFVAAKKTGSFVEAEEIVQDIFASLWHRRASLDITASLGTYLSACVKYKVISSMAKKSQAGFAAIEGAVEARPDHSTENWLKFDDLREQLQKETEKLPEKCRLVFQLSRETGMSQRQIADYLGISQKTVESHLTKALRTLRTSLGQFFGLL